MAPARIDLTPDLRLGGGALAELPDALVRAGCQNVLIITDQVMEELGYLARVQDVLHTANLTASAFLDTVPEPTIACVDAGLAAYARDAYDGLVALGGGSAIDTAKAMSARLAYDRPMGALKVPHIIARRGPPVIAIPTTAGTGSEVTRVTVITDGDTDEKMLCMGPGLMPAAAIVDYELTLTVPPRTTADTGIDSLTHAIEAYVSRKANAFSDQQALGAMRLIATHIRTAFHAPDNHAARDAMMTGAMLAGMAFSNASVALVHGMSRPIGAFFHVPHGLSNAMLLPGITRWSISGAPARYAECARAMSIAGPDTCDQRACEQLVEALLDLNSELCVPSMSEYGLDKVRYHQVLETMAEQAEASGSPANNPRQPNQADMIALYREIWS